jgi:transposase-like protein
MLPQCPRCSPLKQNVPAIVRAGRFYRTSDSKWVSRFKCRICGLRFSRATFDKCYRQKKRRKNSSLEHLLTIGVSMRQCARTLNIHRTTVQRKKTFLALQASEWLIRFRNTLNVSELQFDDMETFEHSKCKPLSIPLAVQKRTRFILGFKVASMPAKGLLVEKALKKYGPRRDERKVKREQLFGELKLCLKPQALIETDQNPHYAPDIKAHFPHATHIAYKGRRGCVVGQGELKEGGYDPLFSLNHTCAMLRANMNRLFRRTWCTTKTAQGLNEHLALYAKNHNLRILSASSS